MDNKNPISENDIAAIAAKAGVSPKGSRGTPAQDRTSGLVFEFDAPDPFASTSEVSSSSGESPAKAESSREPENQGNQMEEKKGAVPTESSATAAGAPLPKKEESAPMADTKSEKATQNGAPVSIFDVYSGSGEPEQDAKANIRATYLPRFTEVSETYRMKDDPRPRKPVPETEERTVAQKVEEASAPELKRPEEELDPTAELDEVTEGVTVRMDVPTHDENSETINVFKFKDETIDAPEQPAPEREEIELKELLKSLGRYMEEERREAAEEPKPEPEQNEPEKSYSVPDPDGDEISVRDFGTGRSDAYTPVDPEGVSNELPEMPTRRTKEFVHKTQRDGFKDKFLDSIMSQRIRLVALCLFFVTIFVYEILADLGKMSYEVFESSTHTGALAAFDLLIVTCMFVFALPEIVSAVRWLIKGKATPELLLIAGYLASAAYLLVVSSGAFTNYPLFGSVFAVLVLSTVISSYVKTKADFTAFKLIARTKEKRILDRKMTRELPEENLALDGLVDEYKSRTARSFRAGFITDFFKKTKEKTESSKQTVIMLSVSFGVAFVAAAIAFFTMGGIFYGALTLNLVFLLGLPAFAILSHKISYHDAQAAARFEDSTVIGEKSYLDFSDVDVIAFEDNDIFGPDDVALKRFMLYGDSDNMEQAMRQMCALFGVVGGPLHFIFSNSLDTRMRTTPAQRPIIEEDGLSGDVGGRRICAGTEEYMRRHGVAIPEGAVRAEGGINTTKIMYAAEDGEVFAKFYIRYSFSEEFTMLLPTLKKEGIVPLIYTGDPNVSNELLKILSAGADCMRVVKRLYPAPEDEKLYSRVSAGVVTYGDKISSIDLLLLTKKYKRYTRLISRLELYGMALGAVAGVAFAFAGLAVPASLLALWQLALVGALRVGTARLFGHDSAKDKKED